MPGINGLPGIQTMIHSQGTLLNPLEYTQFIAATGITDATQKAATLKLVKDLKSTGAWNKLKAIYPMVGGTSQAHKFNLKDPRDLDVAFRLNFSTGWTHSVTGAKPNGVSAYAETMLNAASLNLYSNCALGYYSRTDTDGDYADIGSYSLTEGNTIAFALKTKKTSVFTSVMHNAQTTVDCASLSVANSLGLFVGTRINNVNSIAYKNNTKGIANTTSSPVVLNTVRYPIFIGASNYNGSAIQFSPRECAFAFISVGLTDSEVLSLISAISVFQTTLMRNV